MVHEQLNDFVVTYEFPVDWGQMDSFQHVNNIYYFRYFENARFAYFQKVGLDELLKTKKIGPILAQTSCRFRRPITFPDTIIVGARVKELTPERFIHEYKIVSRKQNAVVAYGEADIVAYDYTKLAKTTYPKAIQDRIRKIDNL